MKPLMLIPPAQAEALYDAQEDAPVCDRSAPPWLDDDSEDDGRGPLPVKSVEAPPRWPAFRQAA